MWHTSVIRWLRWSTSSIRWSCWSTCADAGSHRWRSFDVCRPTLADDPKLSEKKFPKKYVHFNKVCVIFKLSIMITLKVLKSMTLKQCWNVGPFQEAYPNNDVFWVLYKTVPESEKCDFYLGVNYVSEIFFLSRPGLDLPPLFPQGQVQTLLWQSVPPRKSVKSVPQKSATKCYHTIICHECQVCYKKSATSYHTSQKCATPQ